MYYFSACKAIGWKYFLWKRDKQSSKEFCKGHKNCVKCACPTTSQNSSAVLYLKKKIKKMSKDDLQGLAGIQNGMTK